MERMSINRTSPIGNAGGLHGPGGDRYLYSHLQVDAQGSFRIHRGWIAEVQGLNINTEVFGFWQGDPISHPARVLQTDRLVWDALHAAAQRKITHRSPPIGAVFINIAPFFWTLRSLSSEYVAIRLMFSLRWPWRLRKWDWTWRETC